MSPRWLGVALLLAISVTGCSAAAPSSAPASTSDRPAGLTIEQVEPDEQPALLEFPVRVRVPSIGVDSELLDLDLRDDGTLEVPPDGVSAGWYVGSPVPGELGPSVIAGHVDWDGEPGVFYRLRDLRPGAEITVLREDGVTAVFLVTRVEQFAKDEFPTQTVYGDIDHAGLRLITCGGSFDSSARSYLDNIVVFAEFDRAGPA